MFFTSVSKKRVVAPILEQAIRAGVFFGLDERTQIGPGVQVCVYEVFYRGFSEYRNQREELLEMGIMIYEYKSTPKVQQTLMDRYNISKKNGNRQGNNLHWYIQSRSALYQPEYRNRCDYS